MDASHFRRRAANARELAQTGDDIRLSRMLLDVALDLDAEAKAIDAEMLARNGGILTASRPLVPPRIIRLDDVAPLTVGGAGNH